MISTVTSQHIAITVLQFMQPLGPLGETSWALWPDILGGPVDVDAPFTLTVELRSRFVYLT